jgi:hypothetical protein
MPDFTHTKAAIALWDASKAVRAAAWDNAVSSERRSSYLAAFGGSPVKERDLRRMGGCLPHGILGGGVR